MTRLYSDAKDRAVYLTRYAIVYTICHREQFARAVGVAICLIALGWMALQPELWLNDGPYDP